MQWLSFMLCVYSLAHAVDIELSYCKPPDLPKNGGYGPRRKYYVPGDSVRYYCDTDSILIVTSGNNVRICQDTGDWTGDTPLCDTPTTFSMVSQSSTEPNGEAENAVDGMEKTCTSTQVGQKGEWVGDFTTPGELISVMIFLPKGPASYNITLLKANGEELYCDTQTTNGGFHGWRMNVCQGPNRRDATGLKIQSLTNAPLRICEIAALVITSPKCTDPHLFVEDGHIRLDRHSATLVCNNGFRPGRERSVECVREGVWNRKTLYCIESPSNNDRDDEEEEEGSGVIDPRKRTKSKNLAK